MEQRERVSAGSNLPSQLTSFIGRRAECATVAELLAKERLVTLTGAGGCGKTRIAIRVASELRGDHPDGVSWVELARLFDGRLLVNAVVAALEIKEVPGQPMIDTLENHLRDETALLILDNCEHLAGACASLVQRLLGVCPSLTILATSREPLGVDGEVAWRVPSLGLPGSDRATAALAQSESVRLFIDRALRVRPGFVLDGGNVEAVAEICRKLDGMPLAIELAAARIRMMSPQQIVDGLTDSFHLLTGASRTALPRHQTLRASVDWSYSLLSDEERVVFRRLAIFAGGFTLEAAESACSGNGVSREAVLDIVGRLLDRSLLQLGEEEPEVRYRMLETIRQYADGLLGASPEQSAVRALHLAYYADLAQRAGPEMEGAGLLRWLAVFDLEHDNLRAAFDSGLQASDHASCLRLMSGSWLFWQLRGHLTEGRRRLDAALASEGNVDPRLRADGLLAAGALMSYYGDLVATGEYTREALEIARSLGDRGLEGRALDGFGFSAAFLDPPRAPGLFRESIVLLREANDGWYHADAYNGLGIAEFMRADYTAAREAFEQSVRISREIGSPNTLTIGLGILGYTLGLHGRMSEAQVCLEESLQTAIELRDRVFTAQSLYGLGLLSALQGDHEGAERRLDESIAAANETSPLILAFALVTLGFARYLRGDLDQAVLALQEALPLGRELGVAWITMWSRALLGDIARLGGDLVAARSHIGEALAVVKDGSVRADIAIEAAGRLSRSEGDEPRAESLHHEALAGRIAFGSVVLVPRVLDALAGLAAASESFAEAARLFGAAASAHESQGLTRFPVDESQVRSDLDIARRGDPAGFEAAFAEGRAMTLSQAVAYASRGRGERKRPSSGWPSLTPTELEVVGHVAAGLTNPQIAERLFVSRSTVKQHLAHIFTKLGVATRAELASMATRRGL